MLDIFRKSRRETPELSEPLFWISKGSSRIITHFVTSTGQEIEVAAKSRLVIQRNANSIAELLVVGGHTRIRLGSRGNRDCHSVSRAKALSIVMRKKATIQITRGREGYERPPSWIGLCLSIALVAEKMATGIRMITIALAERCSLNRRRSLPNRFSLAARDGCLDIPTSFLLAGCQKLSSFPLELSGMLPEGPRGANLARRGADMANFVASSNQTVADN